MKIINLISGPRNLSTALMYSFSRRPDTKVVDEPFYAHYLLTTGIDHPGREETLSYMSSDIDKIISYIFSTKKSCQQNTKNKRSVKPHAYALPKSRRLGARQISALYTLYIFPQMCSHKGFLPSHKNCVHVRYLGAAARAL